MNDVKQLDVCISLISHNTAKWLKGCLDSIYQSPPQCAIEVWVIDNISTDGTADMVRREFPQVHLIVNEERAGYGANHNKAFSRSSARYILVLNEDTVLRSETIDTMVKFMDATPDAGVAACKVYYGDGRLQYNAGRFPTFLGEFLYFGWNIVKEGKRWYERYKYMEDWKYNECRVVDWLSGCFLFMRGAVVKEIGGFHKDFFMYFEDAEWCYRLRKMTGFRAYFVPSTSIVHYHGQSLEGEKNNREYLAFNGASVYIRSKYGKFFELAFRFFCRALWMVWYALVTFIRVFVGKQNERVRTKREFYRYLLKGGRVT